MIWSLTLLPYSVWVCMFSPCPPTVQKHGQNIVILNCRGKCESTWLIVSVMSWQPGLAAPCLSPKRSSDRLHCSHSPTPLPYKANKTINRRNRIYFSNPQRQKKHVHTLLMSDKVFHLSLCVFSPHTHML